MEGWIQPVFDNEKKIYAIEEFEKVKEDLQQKIEKDLSHFLAPISDPSIYKACMGERAENNKILKTISQLRLQGTSFVLGTWISQCKQLEDLLKANEEKHKALVDEYEKEMGIGRFKKEKEDKAVSFILVATFKTKEARDTVAEALRKRGIAVDVHED